MEKITLDTNVIIDIVAGRDGFQSVEIIVDKYNNGDLDLAITTRVVYELKDSTFEKFNEITSLEELSCSFRFNMSKLSGSDTLSGGSFPRSSDIQKLLFPNSPNNNSHKICDADNLASHARHKRDIFLTRDGQILKKAEDLKEQFGIIVMTPKDYVQKSSW